jgi:hypothetical protein
MSSHGMSLGVIHEEHLKQVHHTLTITISFSHSIFLQIEEFKKENADQIEAIKQEYYAKSEIHEREKSFFLY